MLGQLSFSKIRVNISIFVFCCCIHHIREIKIIGLFGYPE